MGASNEVTEPRDDERSDRGVLGELVMQVVGWSHWWFGTTNAGGGNVVTRMTWQEW